MTAGSLKKNKSIVNSELENKDLRYLEINVTKDIRNKDNTNSMIIKLLIYFSRIEKY